MNKETKPQIYRTLIDAMVAACKTGQGQIGPNRARNGLWNANAKADYLQDQHAMNVLLKKLSASDRGTLAIMLAEAFSGGIFESLKVLEEFQITPFESGYEGSPYHDFIGRLDDWQWPKD